MLTITIRWRVFLMVLYPLLVLSGIGLSLFLFLNLSTLFGKVFIEIPEFIFVMGAGLMIWCAAIFMAVIISREYRGKDWSAAALRGCPKWMKNLIYCVVVYGACSFIYFKFLVPLDEVERGVPLSLNHYRAMTSLLLPFLAGALGIFYSAIHVIKKDPARRCPSGHVILPRAKFCEQCGWEVK
jgi:hypothetical protein